LTFNEKNIVEFRASNGQIASFGDAPLLLLTTTGARSGQRRTTPTMFLADEHEPNLVYVFASAAGAERNPAWFTTSSPTPPTSTWRSASSDTAQVPICFQNHDAPRSSLPGRSVPWVRRIPGEDSTGDSSDRAHVGALTAKYSVRQIDGGH
jgi:hypothetical protein